MSAADDLSALNAFLAGVEHRALRMAEFATRDRDEAMDIVQDAMIRLCDKYARRPSGEWAPLFFRILERRILDWHRRQSVRRRLFGGFRREADEERGEDPAADSRAVRYEASAEETVMADDALERLGGVLEDLPLRQQQVFLLRVWQGLDVRDTARAMGCSEGSVKTHLSRATARLKEVLGERT